METGCLWLTPVILTTWEAEIRRISSRQHGQIVRETPISKITRAKWTGGMAQVVRASALQSRSPEFKPLPQRRKKGKKFYPK
jgi:hypothetical protein